MFFRAKGLALNMAVHRSFHQLMNLIVLDVMSPFYPCLFRYAIRAFNPRASSCPRGGFGKEDRTSVQGRNLTLGGRRWT